MKLILLGTGTSTGVPEVGCACYVCKSPHPYDKRQRSSALLTTSSGKRVLIDCGPDFRQQALQIGLDRIDAVVLTHEHYDHVYGLDDLRTIAWREELPIYGQERVLDAVRQRMHYVFSPKPYPGTPRLDLRVLECDGVVKIEELEIRPIVVLHGSLPIYAYRFHEQGQEPRRDIVYITDMKTIAPQEWLKVEGCGLLVINALRYLREHPSHQNVLDVERQLSSLLEPPTMTVLTHLSHHAPSYTRLTSLLPEDLRVGYDYMCLDLGNEGVQIYPFERGRAPYHLRSAVVASREEWKTWREGELHSCEQLFGAVGTVSESFLLMASTPKGGELALSLSLCRELYSADEAGIRLAIDEAIWAVLRFHQVSPSDYGRLFVFEEEGSDASTYRCRLHLAVNDDTLSLSSWDNRSEALSLRQAHNRDVDVDIIVVESLITAQLSKTLGMLMTSAIAYSH